MVPQPAHTQDGIALAPLAGGFTEPYASRLHLLTGLTFNPLAPADDEASDAVGNDEPAAPWDEATQAAIDAFNAPFGPAEETHAVAEDRDIPGPHGPIPVRIYRPEPGWEPPMPSPMKDGARAGLVWYHGGAFVGGDLDMPEADAVSRGLATRTGSTVVSVFYRLCNDGHTRYPIPHEDAYAAYEWVCAHAAQLAMDPGRIAVGGASAGGNLSGSVALRARDAQREGRGRAPWQALLAYPVLHSNPWPEPSQELAALLEVMPEVLRFPAPVRDDLNRNLFGTHLEGNVPAYAYAGYCENLAGYPSTYIENSENDDLRASGEEFARQLEAAGVDVECVTAAGVPHGHLNAIGSPLTALSLDRFAARLAR